MVTLPSNFDVKWIKFSAGEEQCIISHAEATWFTPVITCKWESANDTMRIVLLVEALNEMGYEGAIDLHIPYMPYSRQDRVTEKGAAFALRAFAKIINSLNFRQVVTKDVHSNVAGLLFNNLRNVSQVAFLKGILEAEEHINCIIAPDAGAYKKVYETCAGLPQYMRDRLSIVCAQKIRNVSTGEIEGMELDENKTFNKHCLILDDICDGGRTFIELAKEAVTDRDGFDIPGGCAHLSLQLAVSHGIFSKGREELNKYYSKIHVLNNMEKTDV